MKLSDHRDLRDQAPRAGAIFADRLARGVLGADLLAAARLAAQRARQTPPAAEPGSLAIRVAPRDDPPPRRPAA